MEEKAVKNAIWIIVCRIIQAILSFIISMLTARYLGPSNFGLINYASSVTAFMIPIMQLGLNSILVQELINYPTEDGKIVGTSLILNFISALMSIVGILSFVFIANEGEAVTVLVCLLYSIMLLTQAIEMVYFWFQAKLLAKYVSIVSLFTYVVISLYKMYLLVTGKSIFWFAISNALDYFIIGIVLHLIRYKLGGGKLEFSFDVARRMLSKSKYYIVSGLMITVFAQTDRVMLKILISDAAVGYYSAAVTIAGVSSFIFTAIIDSMRPVILVAKKSSVKVYENRVIQLYSLVVYFALAQSVFISIFAPFIVKLIYGVEYIPAVAPLRIVVWYTTFSYYGGAKDIWILAEEKQRYLVWLNLGGALANIILNCILIPIAGISGAAIASLITQFFTNVVMGFLIRPLRYNNTLLLKALFPKYLFGIIRIVVSMINEKLRNKICIK